MPARPSGHDHPHRTLGYSKPWIEAVNWYDLDDDHAFIDNGGIIKSRHGESKAAFHRLVRLQDEWKRA